MIVSNMWPIIWLLFMLALVIAFIVAAMGEKSAKRNSAYTMQSPAMPDVSGMDSMDMNSQEPMDLGDNTFR